MLIQRAALLDGTATDIRVEASGSSRRAIWRRDKGEQCTRRRGRNGHPRPSRPPCAPAFGCSGADLGQGRARLRCAVATTWRSALADAAVGSDGWIRAVGYHEAVAGPLDRDVLDEVSPPVPVRVQHRSGVLWTLNSAGLVRVGLADHPDGRLRSADHSWSDTLQRNEAGLAEVSRRLSAYEASPASPTRHPTSKSATS